MSAPRGRAPGTLDLLDEGIERLGHAWSAVGAFWLAALPARVALLELLMLAIRLGPRAPRAGNLLLFRSYLVLALGLGTVYGRVMLGRAFSARPAVSADRWAALRVPLPQLARAVTATLAVVLVSALLAFTVLVPLAALPLLGLLAVSPGGNPLRLLAAPLRLVWLHLLLLLGLLVVGVNLHLVLTLLADGVSAVLPGDPQRLARALTLANPRYLGLLLGGVSLCVEPLWLAALTVHAEALRSCSTGEDLRTWLEEIQARRGRRVA